MTQRPPHFYDKVFAGRTGNDQALQVQGDLTVTKTDGTVVMTVDSSVPTITFDTMDLYLGDSDFLAFGDAQDITMTWDGTSLKVAQATANSAIQLGVDGAGIDVIFEGDTASATMTWDQSADSLIFAGVAKLGAHRIVTVAQANGTVAITSATSGQYHIVGGADVNITLPAVAGTGGCIWHFIMNSDHEFKVTAPSSIMIAGNNATATSVTYTTAGEQIGMGATVFSDGTNYYYMNHLGLEAFTATVA